MTNLKYLAPALVAVILKELPVIRFNEIIFICSTASLNDVVGLSRGRRNGISFEFCVWVVMSADVENLNSV